MSDAATDPPSDSTDNTPAEGQAQSQGADQDGGGMSLETLLNEAKRAARPQSIPIEDDTLAQCLAFLTRYFNRPQAVETLRAGIALTDGRLSEDGFGRAAMRVGLVAQAVEKKLARFKSVDLPAVLLMQDGTVLVVISADRSEGELRLELANSATDWGVAENVVVEDIEEAYSGHAIVVQPRAGTEEDHRSKDPMPRDHWIWAAFQDNKWIFGQALLGTFVVNLLGLALPLFILNVYDRVVPNYALDTLLVLAVGLMMASCFDFGMRVLRGHMVDVAGRRIDAVLGNQLFERLLNLRLNARKDATGSIANSVRELEVLRDFVNSATLASLGDLPFLIIFVGVLWMIAGSLAIVPTIAVPVVLAIVYFMQAPMNAYSAKAFSQAAHRNNVLFEVIGSLETVKAIGAEGWAAQRWERAHAAGIRSGLALRRLGLVTTSFMSFAQIVTAGAIVVMGVFAISNGEITQGALIAAVLLNGRAMAPLAQVAQTLGRLHHAKVAYRAIDAVMRAPSEREPDQRYIHMPTLAGDIKINDVSFAYPPPVGTSMLMMPTVNAVVGASFEMKAGERVGIIGPIGAGKSTILRLILNLYQTGSGSVSVDGMDVTQIDPYDLRANIGYMTQSVDLFQGSIRENITLHHPQATDEEIIQASEVAGVMGWLERCPLGFEQPIGESGQALSGGQRQSIALARALLRDPPMLLFDEPTSVLDGRSEQAFLKRLQPLLKNKTFVIVTHRPALLTLVDRLIVMDKGRIALDGPKEKVLQRLGGQE